MSTPIGNCTATSTPCAPGDGYIYYSGADYKLHQADPDTGQDNTLGTNLTSQSALCVFDGHIYYQGYSDSKLWQVKVSYPQNPINIGNNWVNSVPSVTDDHFLYFQGSDLRLIAIDIADPAEPVWLGATDSSNGVYTAASPCVPGDGGVYFPYQNPTAGSDTPYETFQLIKLDLATQQLTPYPNLYTAYTPGFGPDNALYFAYHDPGSHTWPDKQLLRLDLGDGSINAISTFQADSTPVAPGDGFVYFQGNRPDLPGTDRKLLMVSIADPSVYTWIGDEGAGGYYTAVAPCVPPGEGVLYYVDANNRSLMQEEVWQDYPQSKTSQNVLASWGDVPTHYSPASWMHDLKAASGSTFAGKSLSQVAIPGSHDAGMWFSTEPTGNSVTQLGPIYTQLLSGSRYFDLRVRYWDWWFSDGFIIYHGVRFAEGPPLWSVVGDVARFMAGVGSDETVVLKFSHFDNLTSDVYDQFVDELEPLFPYMFNTLGLTRLADIPLSQLGGRVVVVSDSQYNNGVSRAKGVYTYADAPPNNSTRPPPSADLVVFDYFSDAQLVSSLLEDQQNKFTNYHGQGDLFLLSWTLTPIFPASCKPQALWADYWLSDYYPGSFHNSTENLMINIVYVDYVEFTSATQLCWNVNAGIVASELEARAPQG